MATTLPDVAALATPILAAGSVLVVAAWASPSTQVLRRVDVADDGGIEIDPVTSRCGRVWSTHVWLVVAIVLAALIDPMLAVVAITVRCAWPVLTRHLVGRRMQASVERSVPDAIELLVLVIHAGLTPHQAVDMMTSHGPAPTRPGFAEVMRRVQRGHTLADAFSGLTDELGPSMTTTADTLAIAERHGTPIAHAIEQLSVEVRQHRRRHAEAAARKLPVRLSFPLVACTLPSFVLVAIAPAVLAALSSLGGNTW